MLFWTLRYDLIRKVPSEPSSPKPVGLPEEEPQKELPKKIREESEEDQYRRYVRSVAASLMQSSYAFITHEEIMHKAYAKQKFNWFPLDKGVRVPYIWRGKQRYCAARMLEKYIQKPFLQDLHEQVFLDCTYIAAFCTTPYERRLLNDINKKCKFRFGKPFNRNDVIIRLSDAVQFYRYLKFCYSKLFPDKKEAGRSGFISINECRVPYIIKRKLKLVPTNYFNTARELKLTIHELDRWDLAYMKFGLKVNGVTDKLCSYTSLDTYCIKDVKKHLRSATFAEAVWPTLDEGSNRLTNDNPLPPSTKWYCPAASCSFIIKNVIYKTFQIADPPPSLYKKKIF